MRQSGDGLFGWGFAPLIALNVGVWLSEITLCSSEREVPGSSLSSRLFAKKRRFEQKIDLEKSTVQCCNASKPFQNSVRNTRKTNKTVTSKNRRYGVAMAISGVENVGEKETIRGKN